VLYLLRLLYCLFFYTRQRRATGTADEGRLRTGNEGDEYAAAGVNGGVPECSCGGACTTSRRCCCVDWPPPGESRSVAVAALGAVLYLLGGRH